MQFYAAVSPFFLRAVDVLLPAPGSAVATVIDGGGERVRGAHSRRSNRTRAVNEALDVVDARLPRCPSCRGRARARSRTCTSTCRDYVVGRVVLVVLGGGAVPCGRAPDPPAL